MTMTDKAVKIMLLEDDPIVCRAIEGMLSEDTGTHFDLLCADRLSKAIEYIGQLKFHIILMDLGLPDSQGFNTFQKIISQPIDIPIITLITSDEEELAISTVQAGSQDYIIKGEMKRSLLIHSIQHCIKRHRIFKDLQEKSVTDELTGLNNRRGFLIHIRQLLKIANRTKKEISLMFIDVDDMKEINDSYGHNAGDQALVETAKILKKTFREVDIIARIGGDEFVVLSNEFSKEKNGILINRLQLNQDAFNKKRIQPFRLSLSKGAVYYNPKSPSTVVELLSKADALMYINKEIKKKFTHTNPYPKNRNQDHRYN